jgi:2Fe-2S ferredoxin
MEIIDMPKITLIEFNGRDHTIDAVAGKSLMQNAIDNAVPGIDADCGGACACGTCHCFLDDEWRAVAGEGDAMEEAMLGMRPDRTESSRLSCQIEVSNAMDGMVVRLPEYQM